MLHVRTFLESQFEPPNWDSKDFYNNMSFYIHSRSQHFKSQIGSTFGGFWHWCATSTGQHTDSNPRSNM